MSKKRVSAKFKVQHVRRKNRTEKIRHNPRVKHQGRVTRNLDVVEVKYTPVVLDVEGDA
jgi:hypothetical protein